MGPTYGPIKPTIALSYCYGHGPHANGTFDRGRQHGGKHISHIDNGY